MEMNMQQDSDYVYINKHIDKLPMFCNWEVDTILSFLACFYGGIMFATTFKGLFLCFFVGITVGWIYSKIKGNSIKGFFRHVLYMYNIYQPKTLIPSFKRFFVGA